MADLRQSTSQIIRFGPFLDSGDGVTPETGLTIAQADMQLSKDGAAFAQKNASGNATHDTDGWYSTTFNTTDTGTATILEFQVTVSGALPYFKTYNILTTTAYDAIYTGTFENLAQTDIVSSGAITTANGVAKSDPLYNGAIHVDSINGSSGTTPDTNGTERNPVAGMADALTLSASQNINTIKVAPGSTLTLSGATTGKLMTGSGWTLILDGQNTDNSTIRGALVSGITTNTALVVFLSCRLTDITSGPVQASEGCYISGTYDSASTGPYGFDKIRTVEGSDAKFDFNSIDNTDVTFRQFSGEIAIKNMGSGNKVEIEGQGQITLESTCTDGNFIFDGNFRIDNQSSGVDTIKSDYTVRLEDIEVDTNEIGAAGVGLTQVSLISTGLDAIASTATGMVEIAKAIWDRVLTGATHNINNSAGKKLRQVSSIIFTDGTAQSGGDNSIQLGAGAVTIDDQFRRAKVLLVGGTGEGQEAIVTSSVASTDTLTTTPAWLINPDNTTEYSVIPAQVHTTVRNGGYEGGRVFVDTVNGTPGQEVGVNGTSTNPSSNLVDAYAIAVIEKITDFEIDPGSVLVLPSDSSNMKFTGSNYTVALNGQEVGGTSFHDAGSITGIGINTSNPRGPAFFLCGIGNVTLPPSNGFQCGFFGTFTIGTAGAFTWGGSASVFGLGLTIDFGAALNASTFDLQSWGGGQVDIENAGQGTGTYGFAINAIGGILTINANCSATTNVAIFGSCQFTNNATGITVNDQRNSTETALAVVDAIVDDIVLTTNKFVFTVSNQVDCNMLTHTAGIPTNYITAAGIATSALDNKGNWNIGKTGYSLSQAFPNNFASMSISASGDVSSDLNRINGVTIIGDGSANPFDV